MYNFNTKTNRFYNIWAKMKYRCDKRVDSAKYYKDKGITYDKKWSTFLGFEEDMKKGYKPHLTLDRIDNDGNYCKENCRWATKKEQARNRSNNMLLNGKTLSEWSEVLGIKRSTLSQRFYVYGWSVDRVLSQ